MSQSWRHFPHAQIVHVHDGDSLDVVQVDLGFGVSKLDIDVRLYGSSAPETFSKEKLWGFTARDYAVAQWTGMPVEVWTLRTKHDTADKRTFVRYVACVMLWGTHDVALDMIQRGFARAWDFGKEPRPPFTEFPVADPAAEVAKYKRIMDREFAA